VAAPVWQNSGTYGQTSGGNPATSLTLNAPASIVSGNLLHMHFTIDSVGVTITPPSGWLAADGSPVIISTGGNQGNIVFYKRAGGSEPSTYTINFSANTFAEGGIGRITGAIASGNPYDATNTATNPSSGSTSTPSVTLNTNGADRLIIHAYTKVNSGAFTPNSGYTTQLSGGFNTLGVSTITQTAQGSTGAVVATKATTDQSTAWLGAILPDVAADASATTRALPLPLLMEAAARWRTAWQVDTSATYAATGSSAAVGHPSSTGTGVKATTGATTGATRAATSSTGVKGAANAAAPAAHVSTVDTAVKQAAAAGTAIAHPATGTTTAKKATGTAAPIAHPATGSSATKAATGVGTAATRAATLGSTSTVITGSGTAATRPATTATGGKVGAGAATATARAASGTAGAKQAAATGAAATHPVTAGTGIKRALAVGAVAQRSTGTCTALRATSGAARVVGRSATAAVFVPPDTEPPPEPDAIHVRPAPLVHVGEPILAHTGATPLVHIGGG
jgi:hypothetical protein